VDTGRATARCATVVLALVVVSCSPEATSSDTTSAGDPSDTTTPTPTSEAPAATTSDSVERPGGVDGPVVFGRGPKEIGESALLVGTLRLGGNCLFVETAVGDGSTTESTLVVWRHGTTWDEASMAVVAPSGDRLVVGDTVELGGGYHPLGTADRDVDNLDGVNRLRDCSKQLGAHSMFVE
jgi:hypothetical protein